MSPQKKKKKQMWDWTDYIKHKGLNESYTPTKKRLNWLIIKLWVLIYKRLDWQQPDGHLLKAAEPYNAA